jgi:hypothetical protein
VLSGYAAFTRFKLVRATQVPGMRAQAFHASHEKFDRFNFEASCDVHYSTYNKNLRAHPQHLTRASQLASPATGEEIQFTGNNTSENE